MAQFPSGDYAAVAVVVAAAVTARATDVEDGNAPPWRPEDKYASDVLFGVASSRVSYRVLVLAVNGSPTFSPSFTLTDIGRE